MNVEEGEYFSTPPEAWKQKQQQIFFFFLHQSFNSVHQIMPSSSVLGRTSRGQSGLSPGQEFGKGPRECCSRRKPSIANTKISASPWNPAVPQFYFLTKGICVFNCKMGCRSSFIRAKVGARKRRSSQLDALCSVTNQDILQAGETSTVAMSITRASCSHYH